MEVSADEEARKAFAQLKPVCIDVMRSLSVENLGRLDGALRPLQRLTSPLVAYALFPLRMGIRKLGGSDKVLLEAVLSSLSLVLSRAHPGELALPWELFQELFVFLSMLLDSRMSEGAGFGPPTEETALRAVQALRSLLFSASDSSLGQLYRNLPAIGHCISVLVASLQSWGSRDVQRASLTTLLALSGLAEEDIALFTGSPGSDEDTTLQSLTSLLEIVGKERERGREGTACNRGEVLASFLPGVTMKISKLVTTHSNLGQGVTNLCLLTWARFVSLVMADSVFQEVEEEHVSESEMLRAVKMAAEKKLEFSDNSESPSHPHRGHTVTESPSHPPQGHTLTVERSRQWRSETDGRLAVLAHKMAAVLVTGVGWRGRRGVVLWAHCVLGNCHRTLVAMAPTLLEVLLTLSRDDYPQVAGAARLSLELVSSQHAEEVGGALTAVLEERLYALASSLPRLMRQYDDVQKLSTLQLLAGYLQLLGPHTLTLTHSHPHLSRLTQALLQTLELDMSDCRLLEEIPQSQEPPDQIHEPSSPLGAGGSSADEEDERWWTLSLRYQHFRLPKIETLLQHCCQLLGFFGALPSLLDHLLDVHRASPEYRPQLLVVISHALLGAGGRGCVHGRPKPPHAVSDEERCALVESVLEEVTGDGWAEERATPTSTAVLQCLQLQVVGVCTRMLGAAFLPHLQSQGYRLLARAGSPRHEVASLAVATLTTVASCTGLSSSVADLITASADYLVNCVALTLRGHTHKQEALQVLQAVLKHGASEVLPLMRDSIDELLLCLDLQLLANEGVWSVLRSLAAALHCWAPPPTSEREERDGEQRDMEERDGEERVGEERDGEGRDGEGRGDVGAEKLERYFLDYHYKKGKEQAEQQETNGGGGGEGGSDEDMAAQTKLSPTDQAAVDVLQRCPHFLPSTSPSPLSPSLSPSPSPSPFIPLCVLDCLSHCLHALRHNQRALLPEVHKVWPSFSPRLRDPSPPVALRAVEVLGDMCEVCGDFVRRRVVKGVWPVIAQSLTSLATGSEGADSLYQRTVTCKLQLKLLEAVGILPGKLQVNAADLEALAHACLPYLSSNQPSLLLETCKTSLTALVQLDSDTTWLLLHQLVPMETVSPPHCSLLPYKFPTLADSELFSESATPLLHLTHSQMS